MMILIFIFGKGFSTEVQNIVCFVVMVMLGSQHLYD